MQPRGEPPAGETLPQVREGKLMIERSLERFLFASRWLLAPFYVALVIGLVVLMVKTMQELWH